MSNFIASNGIQLHYLDHGGDGPPLVLLHGLSANAHFFDGLLAAGLGDHFRVLSVDLRGRGQSDKPDSGYSMAAHAGDILGLLDALGIERALLGGHSFGALLTLYLASHHPERVARLVMIDAGGSLHPEVRALIKPSLARLGRVLPSWEAYRAEMQKMPFLGGAWDDALESYYHADVETLGDGSVRARSRPEAIAEAVDQALSEPWPDYLAQVTQPVLLLHARGPFGPPGTAPILRQEDADATVAALADCQYQVMPGNHITMLFGDNAAQTVAAITAFAGAQEHTRL